MLRALGTPAVFAGLVVGFVVAILVQAYVQAVVARALGDRMALRRLGGGVRRIIDPFGAVAAVIAGPGWGVTPEIPLRSRGRLAIALISGPVAVAAVGVAALFGYLATGGTRFALPGVGPGDILTGDVDLPFGQGFFVAAGLQLLGMAVLALVPLPPLPGWRLLELLSTGSVGWQRARHYLVDNNIGVLVLLVLLILPLGGDQALLLSIVDSVVGSLLEAFG